MSDPNRPGSKADLLDKSKGDGPFASTQVSSSSHEDPKEETNASNTQTATPWLKMYTLLSFKVCQQFVRLLNNGRTHCGISSVF